MSNTTVDNAAEPLPRPEDLPSGEPGEAVPREGVGRVDVADQVVEKVAGHAVTLVPDAAAAPRRLLGMNVGEARPQEAASVSAEVREGIASVQATIAVRWPKSVQAVADEVRRRIREDVTAMTGVQVDHVDVDVVSMTFQQSAEPRVR